jgi:hypothetical protein
MNYKVQIKNHTFNSRIVENQIINLGESNGYYKFAERKISEENAIVVNGLRKSFKDLTVFDVHSNGVSVSLYKHTNLKTVLIVLCFEPILKLYRLMLST